MGYAEPIMLVTSAILFLIAFQRTKIVDLLVVLLFFVEYVAIKLKVAFGFQYFGAIKDLVILTNLVFLLSMGRYQVKEKALQTVLLVLIGVMGAWDFAVRPYINMTLILILGWQLGRLSFAFSRILFALIIISLVWGGLQALTFVDFKDLWFYDFLLEKSGDDFLISLYGYFRDERLRPPGYMISPSIMGLAMISLGFIVDLTLRRGFGWFILKIMVISYLYLIQTRALLIGFFAFEFVNLYGGQFWNQRLVIAYYGLLIVCTLILTSIFGDESALVRLVLLGQLVADIGRGDVFFPMGIPETGVASDSQIVTFVRVFGFASIPILWGLFGMTKGGDRPISIYKANLLGFLIFITFFQWSGDSGGYLLILLLIGYLSGQNREKKNFNLRGKVICS